MQHYGLFSEELKNAPPEIRRMADLAKALIDAIEPFNLNVGEIHLLNVAVSNLYGNIIAGSQGTVDGNSLAMSLAIDIVNVAAMKEQELALQNAEVAGNG